MKRILLLSFLFVVMNSQSCTKGSKTKDAASLLEQAIRLDLVAEPEYLDPILAADTRSTAVITQLFEGLVEYHPRDLDPVPAVAKRWEISPDGMTYTFFLQENAKWSDGSQVTSQDFVDSWRYALDPKTGAQYAYQLYIIKNAKALNQGKIRNPELLGARSLDSLTLEVTLEQPTPYFLSVLCHHSFRPVKMDVVKKFGDQWTRPEHMVSNGPFKLIEWIPHQHILLEPNPHYWDREKVKLTKVTYKPLEERETALKLFLSGELDYVTHLPGIKIPSLRNHPEFRDGPHLGAYFIEMNTAKWPLNDKRVRQALVMSLDREKITKVLNIGIPNDSFTPKGVATYMPPPGLGFDPQKAKALFAEAGFAHPKKFPVLTITYNTSENHRMVMELVQSMWKEHLGIEVKLMNMEWKSVLKSMTAKDYELARFGWIGDYVDPYNFLDLFTTASGNNHSGWGNQKYDELLQASTQTLDMNKRFELFREAEALFLEEAPIVPIYTYTWPTLTSKRLKGFYHNLIDIHPLKAVWVE